MSGEYNGPSPEEIGLKTSAEEAIQEAKTSLQGLITEDKDLNSVARYMLMRPFRRMARGGPESSDNIKSHQLTMVRDLCAKIGEPFPTTLEDKQALLSKLNNPDIKQRFESASGK